MKLLKSILVLFIAISITSCSSDDDNSLELTSENLAGTFKITSYKSVETETAKNTAGTVIGSSTTTKNRSSSTIVVTLNSNNTYSIEGILVLDSKTGNDKNDDEINDLNDTKGTYAFSNVEPKTFTLTESEGKKLIIGNFEIKSFNVNSLVLKQETNTNAGNIEIKTITDITLERN
ncbi:hypothetical protein MPF19_00960 [Polaribacter sp. Z014]|uniref:hypothetical protein n=1 Tax=Polaribacter sp. Z014 TaxID=2927126 RepID=UPI00202258BF|nr:hypothetical protein [Polaribacter sp. Z014]MCL7761965.1 hypothetical protein [Polaribacter sp. Z014]